MKNGANNRLAVRNKIENVPMTTRPELAAVNATKFRTAVSGIAFQRLKWY